jgi:hypothetical protein
VSKILIGLAGIAGVGKTTTAKEIHRQIPDSKVLSYAYPLKKSLSELTGLPIWYFKDQDLKNQNIPEIDISPRKLMQLMGTEFVREMVHPDFWIWRMQQSLDKYKQYNIIIDDVRFENEAALIRSLGGVIIHLHRAGVVVIETSTHISECSLTIAEHDVQYILSSNTEESVKRLLRKMI